MAVMTLWSSLAALTFLGILALGLVRICALLDAIGGTPTSYLAKLRFGLRAIDKECSHLASQVTRINEGLGAIDGGLTAVRDELAAVADKLDGGRR